MPSMMHVSFLMCLQGGVTFGTQVVPLGVVQHSMRSEEASRTSSNGSIIRSVSSLGSRHVSA